MTFRPCLLDGRTLGDLARASRVGPSKGIPRDPVDLLNMADGV